MKKGFFNRFEPHEKAAHKSISLASSDWSLIDAYRLYGASKAGYDIPFQKLMREIIIGHINRDKEFSKKREEWIHRSSEISMLEEEQK